MNSKKLKQYILDDQDRLTKILDYYGFHDFWTAGDELRCAAPNKENNTAIAIKLEESLYASAFDSTKPFHGDLFGLLEEYSNESIGTVFRTVHSIFGLSNSGTTVQKIDPLAELRKLKSKNSKMIDFNNKQHDISFLDRFINRNHVSMLEEAISPKVLKMFNIMFDPQKSRIIFPHFDWIDHDKIVGVSGRTTMDSTLAKEFNIPKYWNYIKGYKKTSNLYGYHLSHKNLEESKMLIIFEAEKSVMKQFTMERGIGYSVAVSGHEISEAQAAFIIKNTPPDCEIVIAFDKDVMVGDEKIDGLDFLLELCEKFEKYRKTSFIYDTFDVLESTESPIDKGYKIWNFFLRNRKSRETLDEITRIEKRKK